MAKRTRPIDTPQAIAHRLRLANRDMREAQSYWDKLKASNMKGELFGELWSLETAAKLAIIVVYARSFNWSEGTTVAQQLRADHLGLFAGKPELAKLHGQILACRDQAAAHADEARHPINRLPSERGETKWTSDIPTYTRGMDFQYLDALLQHVAAFTVAKARELDPGAEDRAT